ncbi:MAG TPA: epimerase, partial [Bacillota bacterium]|nr:epimerase [Bacillota bacterium]
DLAKGIVQAAIKGRNKQSYILSGNNINVKQLLDYIAEYSGRKKIRTKLSYWFILSMSYFAEFYYLIRRQKPLFTHYSVKVLNSNHLFSNDKAKRELGFETRDLSESIQDTLQFATEHYLVKVKNKWKKRAMNQ